MVSFTDASQSSLLPGSLESQSVFYGSSASGPAPSPPDLLLEVKKRLYVSHTLSTWNSRVFEFGAVLYLASIFPGTLLPMSVYALVRAVAAIVLSPAVGRYIDAGDRLQVARLSIVLQRTVVAMSCVIFWVLASGLPVPQALKPCLLVIAALLACVEKLSAIMNSISIERDWVVVIAEHNEPVLRVLNAQMRRLDLICKLAGPFFISVINGISTETAILVNFGMNVASVGVEYGAIARVHQTVPALQQPKTTPNGIDRRRAATDASSMSQRFNTTFSWGTYLHHRVFLPSFCGALLYLTVLSFSGQMITYLLSIGFTSTHIAIARTVSVAFEISATWIAPKVMSRIGPIRSGLWFISWQMMCLVGGVSVFWRANTSLAAAFGLVGGTIFSRVGLWGFDLSAKIVVQEEVEAEHRGSFSSLEASWQNAFELCSYITTIVFFRPEQFRWPVLISATAVITAGGLYAAFVRSRRGHLLHLPDCIVLKERSQLADIADFNHSEFDR